MRHGRFRLLFGAGFDIALLLGLDSLPHLNLLLMALLLEHLGPEAPQVLRIFRALMSFTRGLLSGLLVGIQPREIALVCFERFYGIGMGWCVPLAVQFLPSFDIFVLRHGDACFLGWISQILAVAGGR